MELDDAGGSPEEHGQDTGGERVEGPAVADTLGGREAPHEPHDVMRGRPDRFIDDEDPVESGPER